MMDNGNEGYDKGCDEGDDEGGDKVEQDGPSLDSSLYLNVTLR